MSHGTVVNNTTPTPGGFATVDNRGTMTISDSTISDNVGDGVTNYQATITINNSSVSNNTTSGILNLGGGILTLNNSTVSGNAYSGLLAGASTSTVLNNSTVTGNTAPGDGGGIINDGTLTIQNTVVAGNSAEATGPDCYGTGSISSSGYNLIGNTSGCSFSPGTGDLTNVDAHLGLLIGAPGSTTYHPLLPGSPAINAGNPAGCMGSLGPLATDQRGAPRVGRCDMGAYEYVTPGSPADIHALSGSPQRAGPLRAFVKPLKAVVLDGMGSPVNNIAMTFSAPTSGASGTFSNTHTVTETAATNASGIADASPFTANRTMGSYTVTARISGVITTAKFALANFAWYVSPSGNNNSRLPEFKRCLRND